MPNRVVLKERIEQVTEAARAELDAVSSESDLEAWRVRHLGRRSELNSLMRSIGDLPPAERQSAGKAGNAARSALTQALEAQAARLGSGAEPAPPVDVTMPGYPVRLGALHPLTRTVREIRRIFAPLGFRVVEGPEVEWDLYNFELLNIPPDHPSRDMWDTLFVKDERRPGEMLLRTHTSPVQIRVMQEVQPPIRVIMPGKCYRHEDRDALHEAEFMQFEGLAIDEHITMADLRGTLAHFVREMFGRERRLRLRASYFPFTEPSAEAEMTCHVCGGEGCRVCGGNGWIEILGAGMVHPTVLRNVGYDPNRYQGFAFGAGIERIAMLKYGIPDMRMLYRNDLRLLRQFR